MMPKPAQNGREAPTAEGRKDDSPHSPDYAYALSILNADKSLTIYRPAFRAITGSVTSALLLHQIMYWWDKMGGKPFFKPIYTSSPDDPSLTSFQDELNFSRSETKSALDSIATRISKGVSKNDTLLAFDACGEMHPTAHIVIYWRDWRKRTWWQLNTALISAMIVRLYIAEKHRCIYNAGNLQSIVNEGIPRSIYNAEIPQAIRMQESFNLSSETTNSETTNSEVTVAEIIGGKEHSTFLPSAKKAETFCASRKKNVDEGPNDKRGRGRPKEHPEAHPSNWEPGHDYPSKVYLSQRKTYEYFVKFWRAYPYKPKKGGWGSAWNQWLIEIGDDSEKVRTVFRALSMAVKSGEWDEFTAPTMWRFLTSDDGYGREHEDSYSTWYERWMDSHEE
jgi:hypothetical protein